jgi:hypothetical protein
MKLKVLLGAGLVVLALAAGTFAAGKASKIESGKNWINAATYFTFEFDKKPMMGVVIAKIKVLDKSGARNNEFTIIGKSGMVSMRAHDSGEVLFKQNKKGDYLLPVDIAMPGAWAVNVKIMKDKKSVYTGESVFNVE